MNAGHDVTDGLRPSQSMQKRETCSYFLFAQKREIKASIAILKTLRKSEIQNLLI